MNLKNNLGNSPRILEKSFVCPYCKFAAKQQWGYLDAYNAHSNTRTRLRGVATFKEDLSQSYLISKCDYCGEYMFWKGDNIIYPRETYIEPPNPDMNKDIQEDYLEAARVLQDSPRASAALLRLALQKLCKQLGGKGDNLKQDIDSFVKKGLNPNIEKAMESLRLIGNNAVHPGYLDIKEEKEKVEQMFEFINIIAQTMITIPQQIDELHNSVLKQPLDQSKTESTSE